ncbi:hypothetical protein RUM44_005678 [Polyplax serrata]|uniref:Phosphotransferase n=1 Tax=Polyplax serrata TaxID=468196 RepID=A0ABR1AWM1_POLSC
MVLLTHLKPQVIEAIRSLIVEDCRLEEYIRIYDEEISRGLAAETYQDATVKSIVTYVNKLPNGNEEGQFLGLDFSGPTIKVVLVLLQNRQCTMTRKFYDIPTRYMTGKSVKVFDFIAKSLVDFLGGIKLKMLRIPLGVTFGFPIEQTSLQDCKLLRWTKGFECDDLIGKNVFSALKDSIRKYPELKKLFVIGILNDAVSAVLGCAWQDPTCRMGAVIGFGASCCYAEKVDRVTKYAAESYSIRDIYINLESADLGSNGCLDFIRSEFDRQMDEQSKNPGMQMNDKMTSIAYLGEIARLALLRCIEINAILGGVISDRLAERNSFELAHMARIESDPETDHKNCREVLQEFGYQGVTDEDCFQVQFVCRCVSRRSANLVAAQLATVINRINVPMVRIAIDGELINSYPNFKWYLNRKLTTLKKESCDFEMRESEESGLGPAVMAAVFGEEVMDRDEKFRRLPGFPMDKCHFNKKGRCMNPDCNMTHPCDVSNINPLDSPMVTNSKDLLMDQCCKQKKGDSEKPPCGNQAGNKKSCGGCGGCKGYDEIS